MAKTIKRNPNAPGRPEKVVNWKKAAKLAAEFNTGEDIASDQGMSYQTLLLRIQDLGYVDFQEWYKKHSAPGRKSLRQMQMKAAKKGNIGMMIWLGKQELEQSEKVDTKNLNLNATTEFKIGFEDDNPPIDPPPDATKPKA